MIELKPCPICGSTDVKLGRYGRLYGVECLNPYCQRTCTTYYATKKTALNEWNRRVMDGMEKH